MSGSDSELREKFHRLRLIPRFKRSLRKRYLRFRYGDSHFITEYLGARFVIDWNDMVSREVALRNFERDQLDFLIAACARRKPDAFIDIGANSGLYSCILLARNLVSKAVLFEPDRRNFIHLRSNLSLNSVLDRSDLREVAISAGGGECG